MAETAGSLLLRAGLVNRQQLDRAEELRRRAGGTLGASLVHIGAIDEERIVEFFHRRLLVPRVAPSQFEAVTRRVVETVPADMAAEFRVFPLDIDADGTLLLAMADPSDAAVADEVQFFTSRFCQRAVAAESLIRAAIERYHGVRFESSFFDEIETPLPTPAPPTSEPLAEHGGDGGRVATATSAPGGARPGTSQIAADGARGRAGEETTTPAAAAAQADGAARADVRRRGSGGRPGGARPDDGGEADRARNGGAGSGAVVQGDRAPRHASDDGARDRGGDGRRRGGGADDARVAEPERVELLTHVKQRPPAPRVRPLGADAFDTSDVDDTHPVAAPTPPPARRGATRPPPQATPPSPPGSGHRGTAEEPIPLTRPIARARSERTTLPGMPVFRPPDPPLPSLRLAASRDAIAALLLDYVSAMAPRAALFVVRQGALVGFAGRGAGLDQEALRALRIPVDGSSVLRDLLHSRLPYRGPLASTGDSVIARWMGELRGDVLLLPVSVRDKVIAVLYADGVETALPDAALLAVAREAGSAYERLILAQKR